jgi:phosphoglycolate phosphatase
VASYDALLFDNDGVLLELTPGDRSRLEAAVRTAFDRHGVETPAPEHVGDLIYGVRPSRVEEICDAYGIPVASFWRSRDEACSRVQREAIREGNTGLYPDVDVLDGLPGPMGVVSSNQQSTLAFAYDHLDVPGFDVVRGRPMTVESLRRKKPEPYYLERALDELGAETALYVGDSEHDVVAAHEAGIEAAFLRREHNADASLSVTPEYELDSLDALRTLLDSRSASPE